jgi:hypothetical protein
MKAWMKIETINSGNRLRIVICNMVIYPWFNAKPTGTSIVKICKASWRDNPQLCGEMFVKAMRSLSEGFYTAVYDAEPRPCAVDFRVGKRGGLTVRKPFDGKTINTTTQPPCLRIEI